MGVRWTVGEYWIQRWMWLEDIAAAAAHQVLKRLPPPTVTLYMSQQSSILYSPPVSTHL